MCAIMGYTAADIPLSRLENAFSAAKSRGPDGSRSLALPGGSLLFHRLAIMGLHPEGMQPFTAPDGSAVVCNGELYGFRQMKRELEAKGYVFSSGSDCELLLPLWREYGEDMFDKLDAEFALILYDAPTGSFVAARDPIGIRPLHPLRQRAQVSAGPGGQDHALSAGLLLQGWPLCPVPGYRPGGRGLP